MNIIFTMFGYKPCILKTGRRRTKGFGFDKTNPLKTKQKRKKTHQINECRFLRQL
jgi:hypothetical protein